MSLRISGGRVRASMSATALYDLFGNDPFIAPVEPKDAPVAFSAWAYTRERCEVLIGKNRKTTSSD
jgi:hypothetical protein